MMNYETFKEVIVARIKDFLPERFKDSEVKIHHINKVNKQLESMNIVLKDAPNLASPNIYLEDFYNNDFMKENDIDIVLQKMAGMIVEYTLELPNTMEFDFNNMTDQIVMQAVSTERNKELLDNCPHKDLMDLSVVYRFVVNRSENEFDTILITNEIFDNMHITKESLFELAQKNTREIMPASFMPMSRMIAGQFLNKDELLEYADSVKEPIVCTTSQTIMGATLLFDPAIMETIAEAYDNSFYIVPSSINELIVMSDDEWANPKLMSETIISINNDHEMISPEDFLSNNLYYFDRENKEIKIGYDNNSVSQIHETSVEYGKTDFTSIREAYFDMKAREESVVKKQQKSSR